MEQTFISTRRYDLDWLRVLAFGLLIFYHCGMAFVAEWGFHIKNSQTSEAFQYWMLFMNRWRMPLLFLISGAGVWLALGRRTGGQFAAERFKRLFIPLVFGMLVVVPPQIYFERLTQGVQFDDYLQFYKTVFEFQSYPEGSLSWHHLWYLPYVLVYSLVGLPFFLYWRSVRAEPVRENLQAIFIKYPVLLFIICILPAISEVLLRPHFPSTNGFTDDWANHSTYGLYFLIGFIIISSETFTKFISKYRKSWLSIAVILVTILCTFYWIRWVEPDYWGMVFYKILNAANAWAWLLTIFGFGYRYLNFSNNFLQYGTQAVFPFYILHQTITIALVYYMLDWDVGVITRFLMAVIGTFGLSFLLYEFIIRRIVFLHPFFGIKIKKHRQAPRASISYARSATEQPV